MRKALAETGSVLTIALCDDHARYFGNLRRRAGRAFKDDPAGFAAHLMMIGATVIQINDREFEGVAARINMQDEDSGPGWQPSDADTRDLTDDLRD